MRVVGVGVGVGAGELDLEQEKRNDISHYKQTTFTKRPNKNENTA